MKKITERISGKAVDKYVKIVDKYAKDIENDLYWATQDVIGKYQDKLGIKYGDTVYDADDEVSALTEACLDILTDQLWNTVETDEES